MTGVLAAAVAVLLAVLAFFFYRTNKIWGGIEHMIDAAKEGVFLETDFDEGRLSRLESKMYQYLISGQTARQQIEGEREKIKTLVSDISHQTKTPIANMLLYAQLLEENKCLDEEAQNIVFQIEGQADKLNFLIQSLVKISRLESGVIAVRPEKGRIKSLIDGLDFEEAARRKKITFLIGEVPEVTAFFDEKWTLEALSNIVDNGIKYTPSGGEVEVSARDYEMFVRIDIKDTGIGMEEGETAKIFSRFYRSPAVSRESGVGIGLYLAREIISREGGYIKVSSRPMKGSVFSVFLAK
ncbi:MAG TPA: two-component sensor histidine kinase [Lachnospiraceae bacterium]|nr:two-component sensor histidine kinase [Lachnospiraceae bacterium]